MRKIFLTALAGIAVASAANAVVADRLWIIGDPAGGWDPTKGVELTKTSEGVFEYDLKITSEKSGFGFVDQLAAEGDWTTLNAHRYVAPSSGYIPVIGENSMEYATSDYCWDLPTGEYKLTVDTKNMKLILAGDEPVVKPAALYFLGDTNDWTASPEYAFTSDDNVVHTFKATVIRSAEDCTFKIATNGWATEYSNGKKDMKAGNTYPIGPGKDVGNMGFAEDIEDATLILDTKAMTLTVLSGSSAVTEIAVDENAPVEYYNLQGVRVSNPKGLVIRKQGSKVTKTIIR